MDMVYHIIRSFLSNLIGFDLVANLWSDFSLWNLLFNPEFLFTNPSSDNPSSASSSSSSTPPSSEEPNIADIHDGADYASQPSTSSSSDFSSSSSFFDTLPHTVQEMLEKINSHDAVSVKRSKAIKYLEIAGYNLKNKDALMLLGDMYLVIEHSFPRLLLFSLHPPITHSHVKKLVFFVV
jgi:hypothetical protein